jgi:hypothetical protein
MLRRNAPALRLGGFDEGAAGLAFGGLGEEVAQHGVEDAAVLVVADIDGGVEARAGGEVEAAAVLALGGDGDGLAGEQLGGHLDVVRLATREPELFGVLTVREDQWQHAHADQVGAVDALEALGDDGADAEQQRALGRPVARASRCRTPCRRG